MKPYKYTAKSNGDIIFHYKYSELKEFLREGFEKGNVGVILTGRYTLPTGSTVNKYRGFGTIENPCKNLIDMDLIHFLPFDGELKSPELIVHPSPEKSPLTSYRYQFLDLS